LQFNHKTKLIPLDSEAAAVFVNKREALEAICNDLAPTFVELIKDECEKRGIFTK
jgi:hypothetical protein